MGILRKLRAVLVTAVVWAGSWALASQIFLIAAAIIKGVPLTFLFPDYFLVAVIAWGSWGALSGVFFAGLLSVAESRRSIDKLSSRRIALWGAVAGGALPVITYLISQLVPTISIAGVTVKLAGTLPVLASVIFTGLLGGGAAAGHLAIARQAIPDRSAIRLGTGTAT